MFTYYVVFDIKDKRFAKEFYDSVKPLVSCIRVSGIRSRVTKDEPIRVKMEVDCFAKHSGLTMEKLHSKVTDISTWCLVRPIETIEIN